MNKPLDDVGYFIYSRYALHHRVVPTGEIDQT